MEHHHDYVPVSDSAEGRIEVCTECKKRLVTKKNQRGQVDNKQYLREHVRDTAQPGGTTAKIFARYYGKPKT